MSIAFDEFGRPFIIIREQEKKKRLRGLEAFRVNITFSIFPKQSHSQISCLQELSQIS